LSTQPGSAQQLKFVCTPAQHRSGTFIPFSPRAGWEPYLLQAGAFWMVGQRSGLAGSSNLHCPAPLGGIAPPSTSQGNRSTTILVPVLTVDHRDTGYMTVEGPCPIFKGLLHVCLAVFRDSLFFGEADDLSKIIQRSVRNMDRLTSRCFPSGAAARSLS